MDTPQKVEVAKKVKETEEERENRRRIQWENCLRELLPVGAPIPDEEHVDYSFFWDFIEPKPLPVRPKLQLPFDRFRPRSRPIRLTDEERDKNWAELCRIHPRYFKGPRPVSVTHNASSSKPQPKPKSKGLTINEREELGEKVVETVTDDDDGNDDVDVNASSSLATPLSPKPKLGPGPGPGSEHELKCKGKQLLCNGNEKVVKTIADDDHDHDDSDDVVNDDDVNVNVNAPSTLRSLLWPEPELEPEGFSIKETEKLREKRLFSNSPLPSAPAPEPEPEPEGVVINERGKLRAQKLLSNSRFNTNANRNEEITVVFTSDDDDDDGVDGGDGDDAANVNADVNVSPLVWEGKRRTRRMRMKMRMRMKKRGKCSRCGKGNRLSRREICIVCDAKYCKRCLLKAMGSMPEGRKCVLCIGKPVDETRRLFLGKYSRFLYKVCSPFEVEMIMKAEKECFANQLRPDQVVVNGKVLVHEELFELLSCSLPPSNLKPGRYWYDKESGLWGKEGEKPDRIISSKLNVGGKLQADSSNGNTKVFFNGREITKVELRVLKLAKVQCPQNTHFWVYDDGSYEEEGQNKIMGNIWEKTSTRILSSLLSLPVPPGKCDGVKQDSTACSGLEQGKFNKLLLVGLQGSGTSTIFKQAKLIYGNAFTAEELEKIKFTIQSNLFKYLGTLLEGRESFEEETLMEEIDSKQAAMVNTELSRDQRNQCIFSLSLRLKKQAECLLEIMASGDVDAFFPAAAWEYAPLVEELWREQSIQETYRRMKELHFLPEVAKYYLDRAVEISNKGYEPSEMDIMYAEGATQSNGLASLEFSFGDKSPSWGIYEENLECLPSSTKYQLIHLNSCELHEGFKWFDMFDDVRAVLFCVALSDYDEFGPQTTDHLCNKMVASRNMFARLVEDPSFSNIPFILLLNKYDTFEEKINRVPLTVCEWFGDFCPLKLRSNSQCLAQQAYYYVAVKFKELYAAITGCKLYVWKTQALERASIDEAFSFVHEVVKWNDFRDANLYGPIADDSFYSMEGSSAGEG